MKILKKGNAFVAYREEKDCHHPMQKVGSEIGRISIKSGKFTGGTDALVELSKHLEEYLKKEDATKRDGVTYKLWITIEKIDENKGTYETLKFEDTRSVGELDTLNEAREEMHTLGDRYQGKK